MQHHPQLNKRSLQFAQLRFVAIQLTPDFRPFPPQLGRPSHDRGHLSKDFAQPSDVPNVETAFTSQSALRSFQEHGKVGVHSFDVLAQRVLH
jgi:hypothetical protein